MLTLRSRSLILYTVCRAFLLTEQTKKPLRLSLTSLTVYASDQDSWQEELWYWSISSLMENVLRENENHIRAQIMSKFYIIAVERGSAPQWPNMRVGAWDVLGGWAGWSLVGTQTGDATTHSLRLFPDVVQGAARRGPDLQSRQTSQPDVGPDTGITALSHLRLALNPHPHLTPRLFNPATWSHWQEAKNGRGSGGLFVLGEVSRA